MLDSRYFFVGNSRLEFEFPEAEIALVNYQLEQDGAYWHLGPPTSNGCPVICSRYVGIYMIRERIPEFDERKPSVNLAQAKTQYKALIRGGLSD